MGESFSLTAPRVVLERARGLPEGSSERLSREREERPEGESFPSRFTVFSEELEDSEDLEPIAKVAIATNAQTRWTRYDFFMRRRWRPCL